MPSVKYFRSKRVLNPELWEPIFDALTERGSVIHVSEPVECDVSVVLNGKVENPVPLSGKKVLVYDRQHWSEMKWKSIFKNILEEYYDDMIDIHGMNLAEVVQCIEEIC